MRAARLSLCVSISFLLSISLAAQQTATSSPQAVLFLQQSLRALAGGQTLSDVTLSGTVRHIAGSDDDTGTIMLKALATGESRVDLILPSGTRTEVRSFPNSGPTGSWVGPDGVVHAISQHNLWTDSSWFFPALTMARMLSSGYIVSYVGHETKGAEAVEHLYVTRQFRATGAPPNWTPDSLQHLAGMDLYLNATSLLPSSISFKMHPDKNALLDLPIEIRFSDYRSVAGVQIPFHIQRFFNNGLDLELQLQNSSINSDLSASSFSL
jgi:hypothetical protein